MGFAEDLLSQLGAPQDPESIKFLNAWAKTENCPCNPLCIGGAGGGCHNGRETADWMIKNGYKGIINGLGAGGQSCGQLANIDELWKRWCPSGGGPGCGTPAYGQKIATICGQNLQTPVDTSTGGGNPFTALIAPITAFIEWVTKVQNWVRVGEVLLGAIGLVLGMVLIASESETGKKLKGEAKSMALGFATKGLIR